MIHPRIISAWESATEPKDRRPLHEWAKDNVQLFPPLTRTGFLDVSTSRQLIAPMSALDDDHVREVNVMAPPRSGKSLIGDAWLPSTVKRDPGQFRFIMQDDKVAKEHMESRILKTLKAVPGVDFLLPTDRHKDRAMEIIMPSGHNLYAGGPALGRMQSKGYRYIWVSEIWLEAVYKNLGEIKARQGDFIKMGINKLFCEAQGGCDGDPWDAQFKSGEVSEWTIECQKCGHFQIPEFQGMREDGSKWGFAFDSHKDDRGHYIVSKTVPTIRYECEKCGHPHIDGARLKDNWNRTGKYRIIGDPHRSKKSFHWNFIIDCPWQSSLETWLQARNAWKMGRDIQPTITFWQKQCATPKSPRMAQAQNAFRRAVYKPTDTFAGEVARFLTIDRQSEDLFWVTARVWTVVEGKLETRKLFFGKCFSFLECEAKREELKVPCNWTLIDSGYKSKGDHGVYAACIKYGWIAVKGVGGVANFTHNIKTKTGSRRVYKSYAPMTRGDSETAAGECDLIRFADQTLCDKVQGLIDSGAWIEPQGDGDPMEVEYRKQMSAVAQVPKKDRYGNTIFVFETLDDNNHAWDVAKFQCLGAVLTDIIPDPFEFADKPAA